MARWRVTVLEHRNHEVEVDAPDLDTACELAEADVRLRRRARSWRTSTPLVEAVEATEAAPAGA